MHTRRSTFMYTAAGLRFIRTLNHLGAEIPAYLESRPRDEAAAPAAAPANREHAHTPRTYRS